MPIYEFECPDCRRRFDRIIDTVALEGRRIKICCGATDGCGSEKAARVVLSVPQRPIIAKGGGETYARKKAPPGYDHFHGGTN